MNCLKNTLFYSTHSTKTHLSIIAACVVHTQNITCSFDIYVGDLTLVPPPHIATLTAGSYINCSAGNVAAVRPRTSVQRHEGEQG